MHDSREHGALKVADRLAVDPVATMCIDHDGRQLVSELPMLPVCLAAGRIRWLAAVVVSSAVFGSHVVLVSESARILVEVCVLDVRSVWEVTVVDLDLWWFCSG